MIVGDADTLAGLRAPFHEEETTSVRMVERLLADQEIVECWKRKANFKPYVNDPRIWTIINQDANNNVTNAVTLTADTTLIGNYIGQNCQSAIDNAISATQRNNFIIVVSWAAITAISAGLTAGGTLPAAVGTALSSTSGIGMAINYYLSSAPTPPSSTASQTILALIPTAPPDAVTTVQQEQALMGQMAGECLSIIQGMSKQPTSIPSGGSTGTGTTGTGTTGTGTTGTGTTGTGTGATGH